LVPPHILRNMELTPIVSDSEEDCIEALRKWPLTRKVLGDLLDDPDFPNIFDAVRVGAKVVGYIRI